MHEKIVCHQTRQKGAQRKSLHGVNDRLNTFSTQYGGKIALVQRSLREHPMSAQDIEIYIKGINHQAIEQWLDASFDDLVTLAQNNKQTRYQAHWNNEPFSIIVLTNVSDGFTSVWFNHSILPWRDDAECTEAAFAWLTAHQTDVELLSIRCVVGGWQEEQANHQEQEAWLQFTHTGKQTIVW